MNEHDRLNILHKLIYLANEYPDKSITELAELFRIPIIDINAAIWMAQDSGFISVDEKKKTFKVENIPEKWELGKNVAMLVNTLLYVFRRLAKDGSDIEDGNLALWLGGYPTHDTLIAIKYLINENNLVSYTLKDGKDEYTFYTLTENTGKKWGQKQFKDKAKLKMKKKGKK